MPSLKEFSSTPYTEPTIFVVSKRADEHPIGHIERNYDRSDGIYYNACAYESANETIIQNFPDPGQALLFVNQHGVPVCGS